jgi:hypothetical protein
MENMKIRELLSLKEKHIIKARSLAKSLDKEKKIIGDIEVELLRRGTNDRD